MPKKIQYNKDEVLKKATNVFWEKGFYGTSIQDLTSATGINRSSLYHAFTDKENLFIKCLIYYREHYETLDFDLAGNPIQKIYMFFKDRYTLFSGDEKKRGSFLVNAATELANQNENVHGLLARHKRTTEFFFKKLLDQAKQKGQIPDSLDTKTYSAYLFFILNGVSSSAHSIKDFSNLKNNIGIGLSPLTQENSIQ